MADMSTLAITQTPPEPRKKRSITAREMGRRSAKARMIKLTPEQRQDIARRAVQTRWSRVRAEKEAAVREAEARLAAAVVEATQGRRRRRVRMPAA